MTMQKIKIIHLALYFDLYVGLDERGLVVTKADGGLVVKLFLSLKCIFPMSLKMQVQHCAAL